jgi:hypothetical protein
MTPKICALTISWFGGRIFICATVPFGFWQLSDPLGFYPERSCGYGL